MALNNEPENNGNGTPDESANRTFRVAVMALGGIALLGVIVIAVFLLGNSGQRQQLLVQQQAVNATNVAATQIAQITPTDTPPNTLEPTEPPKPPTATPTLPPTVAPTLAPQSVVTSTGTTTAVGLVTSTPKSPSASVVSGGTAKPASSSTSTKTTSASNVTSTTGITSSTTLTNTSRTPDQIAKTGAGDYLGFLLAGGLIVLLFVARRLRTAQA